MGLFTGFSVISGIELLYWIIFKVIFFCNLQISLCRFSTRFLCAGVLVQFFSAQVFFHKKDTESSDDGSADKKELGWRERRSQNEDTEDTEVTTRKHYHHPNYKRVQTTAT